jgi:RNA polymerase sigma-70 factor, ECF subfamily
LTGPVRGYVYMASNMAASPEPLEDQLRLARAGDASALAELFTAYRERLRRMIHLRLDRRLTGRVDTSDILQDVYLEVRKRITAGGADPNLPFFLWLRLVTGQKLTDLHRRHLGTRLRDAGMEVSLHRGAMPAASSASLAAQLLGTVTSASQAAVKAEHRLIVQEALNGLDPIDREILVLRHFEYLSNDEAALALGLKRSTASQRYLRALKRLKDVLSTIPGLREELS